MGNNKNISFFLIIIFTLTLIGGIIFLWIEHLDHKDTRMDEDEMVKELHPVPIDDILKIEIGLYYGAEGDKWIIENRLINFYSDKIEDRLTQVIEEFLKGPGYHEDNPIPKDTRLMGVFFDQNNIVYIDFSEAFTKNHPGGTWGELMSVYCVVNTIIGNFPTIKGVKILIMGKEKETLKGHIDIRYPLSYRKYP